MFSDECGRGPEQEQRRIFRRFISSLLREFRHQETSNHSMTRLERAAPGVLPANTTERMLVVDGKAMNRLIVARTSDHAGFATTPSSDGEEALDLIIINSLP